MIAKLSRNIGAASKRTVSSYFSPWLPNRQTVILVGGLDHVPSVSLCHSFIDCITGP